MAQCVDRGIPERQGCTVRSNSRASLVQAVGGGALARNAKGRERKVHQDNVAARDLRKVQPRPPRPGTKERLWRTRNSPLLERSQTHPACGGALIECRIERVAPGA